LVRKPFPVQIRIRFEMLGPTYIKLGQVMSLREDLLPRSITSELQNLLHRLPEVPYKRFCELIEEGIGRPVSEMYRWISPCALGSASIAQTHRATTLEGNQVIIKLVKPGIKTTLERDAILINWLGWILNQIVPQYQPRRALREFTDYTLREVDLRLEGNNAEVFTANFRDLDSVRFPRIYQDYSSETVLCMEFFDGIRPDSAEARAMAPSDLSRLIDTGSAAIIRMLYQDGFFHADLHPGNLIILEGNRCGFIDLGMVGRFDDRLRRTLLYYYYCLVTGDAENAARYLCDVATSGRKGNPEAFKREVSDISRQWQRSATFESFSLAQLIMRSVNIGAKYRMYFPIEMVLMVKALITFEGVGNMLKPGFDVAAVSRKHISKIFMGQFNPVRLMKESLRGAPEVVDALVKAPLLVTQSLRALEEFSQRKQRKEHLEGIHPTLMSGFLLIAGCILFVAGNKEPMLTFTVLGLAGYLAIRKPR
jgi:ubiquinone biosynthesis protein